MNNIFQENPKKIALNQLKIDLISRYYPFSKEELIKYYTILNFNGDHLMANEHILWDTEILLLLQNNLDWSALWKLKNICIDTNFFKTFEHKIDFKTIQFSKCIHWTDDLIQAFESKLNLSKLLVAEPSLATIENLRRFQDKLDWSIISQSIPIVNDLNIINEFREKWDWKKLSANRNLPLTLEFILTYIQYLDFDEISQNPKSLDLIYKYPKSKMWNWQKVSLNKGIIYNETTFNFVFEHYNKTHDQKNIISTKIKSRTLQMFLYKVFYYQQHDINYFLQEPFLPFISWELVTKSRTTKVSIEFIIKHKNKLNFKESIFMKNHSDIIPKEFIHMNIYLFDTTHYSFYNYPLTQDFVSQIVDKINWNQLSTCKNLDWTWRFINLHFEKFNKFKLSQNEGVYIELISKGSSVNKFLAERF